MRLMFLVAIFTAVMYGAPGPPVYGEPAETLPVDTTVSGTLTADNSSLDYVLTLAEDAIIEITVSSKDADASLKLIDDLELTVSARETKSFPEVPENNRYYMYAVERGTYTVHVFSYQNEDLVFTLTARYTPAVYDNNPEPDDTEGEASSLPVNNSRTGHLGYTTEGYVWSRGDLHDTSDWWFVETTSDGVLTIQSTVIGCEHFRANINLYDIELNKITAGYQEENTAELSYYVVSGTYYIKVYRPAGNPYDGTYGSYTLSNELLPASLPNDPEPNDSREEARTIDPNQSITGHLGYCIKGDYDPLFVKLLYDTSDYYKVDLPTEGVLTLTANFEETMGVVIAVTDTLGRGISSGYPDGLKSKTGYYLSRGTYYIKLHHGNSGDYGSYTLTSEFAEAKFDNDPEPNNSFEEAQPLSSTGNDTGHIGYCTLGRRDAFDNYKYDYNDYWTVRTDVDGYFTARVVYDETAQINVMLYDGEQKSVRTSYGGDEPVNTISWPIAAGLYYLRLQRRYDGHYSGYSIETRLETPLFANDREPNDTDDEAVPMLFNDTETGHLGYCTKGARSGGSLTHDTKDWWQFSIENPQNLDITVTTDADTLETQIELYNSDVKSLKYVYSKERTAQLLYDDAKPGTYFVKVARRSYTSGYGSYQLSLNHTPPAYLPPSNVSVTYENRELTVTWDVSNDDSKIDGYRICRSRCDVFSEPVDCGTFGTVEGIHEAETNATVIVGTTGAGTISFTDPIPLTDGNYYYWVTATGPDGESLPASAGNVLTGIEETVPTVFRVCEPFPNPFNPTTTLRYELPDEAYVRIEIFDITGRRIAVLADCIRPAGLHESVWNGRDSDGDAAASGVYLYRFSAGVRRAQGKMTLVR